MPIPFLNSIKLNKNQVEDFCVFNYSGDPTLSSGADFGYLWLNTSATPKVLKFWDGTNYRTLIDSTTISSSTAGTANDLSGGVAGSLPYQQGVGDTTFLGIGTANQVLTVNSGATAPQWLSQSSLSVGSATTATTATTATNVAGGANGSILVQSGAGTTGQLAIGANGYILTSNGTTPGWSATIPSSSVSGLAASATTDTTNASNISSGTLGLARLSLASGQFYVGDGSNNPAATAKSSIPLSGFGAAGADVAMGGFKITGLGTPTASTDAANKDYVDGVAQGLDVKASCLVATTADITLASPGAVTIDGIYSATDFTSGTTRILVKDQSAPAENGIYIWQGPSSAMTRSADANTWDELVGAFTFVERGTANADSGWVCNVNAGGTLGTTAVTWTKFSQAGSYTAGNGMVLSGGVFHFAQSSAYTAGQIPFCSNSPTANSIGFSSNLFWDNGNNRLGIGTATPNATVSIKQTGAQIDVSTSATDVTFEAIDRAATTNAINTRWYTRNGEFQWNNSSYSRAMTLDSSGNLALAATPSAWISAYRAIEIGATAGLYGRVDSTMELSLALNGYRDNSGAWVYRNNGAAALYNQNVGDHYWYTATAGTATNNISWGDAKMTLLASGNLGVGKTPNSRLHVYTASGTTPTGGDIQDNGAVISASSMTGTSFSPSFSYATTLALQSNQNSISAGTGASIGFQGKWESSTYGSCAQFASIAGLKENSSDSNYAGYLTFATRLNGGGPIERLRLSSTGQALFSTNGTSSAPTIANADNPDTGLYWPTDADTLALAVGGSDAVYIDSSRNVGIGTATPAGFGSGITTLDIKGSSGSGVKLGNATDSSYLYTTSTATYFRTASLKSIIFGTFDTERLTIKSTGQLNFTGLASDPAGAAGDVYYNSGSNVFKVYDTGWKTLPRKYVVQLSDGSVTVLGNAYTITHNLGSQDVTVSIRRTTDNAVVQADVVMPAGGNTVTVTFAAAITAAQFYVTVIG